MWTDLPWARISVGVWQPGFVDPGPAAAFLVIKCLHQRDILFSLVHVHSDIGYKNYKIVRDVSFFINLDVPVASLPNKSNLEMGKIIKSDITDKN